MISRIALLTVVAVLGGGAASGASAQVRVAIVAKGDVGQYAGMCDGGTGTDSLAGTLVLLGVEDDGAAFYEGRLSRTTDVDACGTKPSPTEDQVTLCLGHLTGSAAMDVTLDVYEDDRGAWLKSKPVATPLPSEMPRKSISGCPEPGELLNEYPGDGWMSGIGLETVPSGVLLPGTYTTETVTMTVY